MENDNFFKKLQQKIFFLQFWILDFEKKVYNHI